MGRQGLECMGFGSAAGGVCDSFSLASSSLSVTHTLHSFFPQSFKGRALDSEIQTLLQKGAIESASQSSWVFQPHVCGVQGIRGLEADYRSIVFKSFCGKDPIQVERHSVGTSLDLPVRLHGFNGSQGCVPSSFSAFFTPQFSAVCVRGQDMVISSLVLRPHHGASGVHPGSGSGFSLSTSFGLSCPTFHGRLVNSCGFLGRSHLGEGRCFRPLHGPGIICESIEVLTDSSGCVVSMGLDRFTKFPGFTDSIGDRYVLFNSRGLSILWGGGGTVCEILEGSVRLQSPGFSFHLVPGGRLLVHSLLLCLRTHWDFLDCSQLIRWDTSSQEDLLW